MTSNDLLVLDSLIEAAGVSYGPNLDQGEVFELYAFEQLLKEWEPTIDDLELGWTDGRRDGGIDGFFVFVDGLLLKDDIVSVAARKASIIDIVLISVQRNARFRQGPLNSMHASISEFFDLSRSPEAFRYPFSADIIEIRERFKQCYVEAVVNFPILRVSVNYVTRGDASVLADNLTSRMRLIQEQVEQLKRRDHHPLHRCRRTP